MRLTAKDNLTFEEIKRINDESFLGTELPYPSMLRYEFDNGDVFVDEECERAFRGYAIVNRDGASQPFLWSLATDPTWRGRGVATRLLKEIIGYYSRAGADRIDLTVKVDNPAQKLYFDQGWRATRVFPRYYGTEAGIRMRRTL